MSKVKRAGVLRFPGTNCDQDVFDALESVGFKTGWCWHKDSFSHKDFDFLVVPGGFSYGDYLRAGALAAHSKAVHSLVESACAGVPILGICNGFQVLCEAGLLPGALLRNEKQRFIDRWVQLKWVLRGSLWGVEWNKGDLMFPIAHAEGRFYVSPEELDRMKERDQIWLQYEEPINGSIERIAGVLNSERNVAGLMPHPERAMSGWMGGEDGRLFFEGVLGVLN